MPARWQTAALRSLLLGLRPPVNAAAVGRSGVHDALIAKSFAARATGNPSCSDRLVTSKPADLQTVNR